MKRKIITIVSIAIILLIGSGAVIASGNYFEEPTRPTGLSKDIVWDTEKGVYVLKELPQPTVSSNTSEAKVVNPQYDWYLNHKNSTDVIDKAIVKWLDNYDKKLGLLSYYSPDDDTAFKTYILPLGIKELANIYLRIKNDPVWDGFMMTTFAKISKIKDLEKVSVSPDEKKKWIDNLKEKVGKAQQRYKDSVDNKIEDTNYEQDFDDLGVLALPYFEQEKKNGKKIDSYVTKLYENSEDISVVNNFIESIGNGK